jgi:hypothetical protein
VQTQQAVQPSEPVAVAAAEVTPPAQTQEPVATQATKTPEELLFDKLTDKLMDRNVELGTNFKAAVTMLGFNDTALKLQFHAPEEILKPLRAHYKDIVLPFIHEIFGLETKVDIQSKPWEEESEKKNSEIVAPTPKQAEATPQINIQDTQASGLSNYAPDLSAEPVQQTAVKEPIQTEPEPITAAPITQEEDPNGSGSCVVGCGDQVPAEKSPEFDQGAILEDPMVKKAIELFGTKIKIQNKV